jgi:nucleotide-binding universal stress UspA family protein
MDSSSGRRTLQDMTRDLHRPPRRILAAARSQDDDRTVVRYAAELARSLGAELILIAVTAIVPVQTTAAYPSDPFDFEAQRTEQDLVDRLARERLDELASTLPAGLVRECSLAWGTPGPATVQAAREHDADLVVVPMRTRNHELEHALHDHADRYVLHHCDVPVLVVPTACTRRSDHGRYSLQDGTHPRDRGR